MKLKRCLTLVRAGVLDFLQFRASVFVVVAGNLIYLLVIYNLWKAIYASVETETVNGMTFTDTMIYLVLATAVFNFMEAFLVWDMGRSIQTGEIVLELLKPMRYESYKFYSQLGGTVVSFLTTFLPTFVVIELITGCAVPLGANLLYFIPAVVFGTIINFSIDFFVGTICLYSQSIWGINIMKEVTVLFFSGATVPIAFFPEWLRKIADVLPFQSIYNTPLRLLTDSSIAPLEALKLLGFQLMWVVLTLVISKLFWQVSLKKITVNGG